MRHQLSVTVALAIAIVSSALAAIPTGYVTLTRREGRRTGTALEMSTYLGNQKGELFIGESRFATYDEDSANRWIIDGDHLRCSTGGYLAYDLGGKDRTVKLVSRRGEGMVWMNRGIIRVGAGAFKGWYLDVENRTERDGQGKLVSVRRLVVVKEAPERLFRTEAVFIHK
jgi:hypothetical protein